MSAPQSPASSVVPTSARKRRREDAENEVPQSPAGTESSFGGYGTSSSMPVPMYMCHESLCGGAFAIAAASFLRTALCCAFL